MKSQIWCTKYIHFFLICTHTDTPRISSYIISSLTHIPSLKNPMIQRLLQMVTPPVVPTTIQVPAALEAPVGFHKSPDPWPHPRPTETEISEVVPGSLNFKTLPSWALVTAKFGKHWS